MLLADALIHIGAGVLMVRHKCATRIERTGVRDSKKAHLGPLAKRAGARCAFCVQTDELVRVDGGGLHGKLKCSRQPG